MYVKNGKEVYTISVVLYIFCIFNFGRLISRP